MSGDPFRTPEPRPPLWDATEEERRFWDTRYHALKASGYTGHEAAELATIGVERRREQLGKR